VVQSRQPEALNRSVKGGEPGSLASPSEPRFGFMVRLAARNADSAAGYTERCSHRRINVDGCDYSWGRIHEEYFSFDDSFGEKRLIAPQVHSLQVVSLLPQKAATTHEGAQGNKVG
jgi:hypothetical protein